MIRKFKKHPIQFEIYIICLINLFETRDFTLGFLEKLMKYYDEKAPEGHVDIISLVRKGQLAIAEAGHKKEKTRVGHLRGGSAGAIIDGEVYGECHRKAHLRMLGIDTPLKEEIELMTRQGEQNEVLWIEELRAAGCTVLNHDDLELELELFGKTFKGSPDVALADENGKPFLGIELKNLSSGSKSITVSYQLAPDVKHLIQTATYSVMLAKKLQLPDPIPYMLVYSSRNIWHVYSLSGEAKKAIQTVRRDVNVQFMRDFSITPFHRIYYTRWNSDGCLEYFTSGLKEWTTTPLKEEHIYHYYEAVAVLITETKDLGPRPCTKSLGAKKKGYSMCNYCEFADVCDTHEENYDAWVDHARLISEELYQQRYSMERNNNGK